MPGSRAISHVSAVSHRSRWRPRPRGRAAATTGGDAHHSLREPVTDQNFYFVMADRFQNGNAANDNGGLPPGKSEGQSGFDPTGKGWYHGGDLKGLRSRLGYIKGLGTTAIWLTPSFKNKAVQDNNGLPVGRLPRLLDHRLHADRPAPGHQRRPARRSCATRTRLGIKVYFDIISNHTADVIRYQEGAGAGVHLQGPVPVPDRRRHGVRRPRLRRHEHVPGAGADRAARVPAAAAPLRASPTTRACRTAEQNVKVPAWLNDVSLYHNRGNTTFVGENSQYGDFFGLDDLFTENPRVVDGMIDIYKFWIREFRVDGFRMDTMKHVDDAFWQRFAPAIAALRAVAGRSATSTCSARSPRTSATAITSHYPVHDDVQGVLDFLFQVSARRLRRPSRAPTDSLRDFFVKDDWYTDGDSNVYNLPTFLGNHDRGRIGMFIRNANPGASEAELLQRDRLAHELMYFSRGNPVVYYGDEQGFTGAGGDQDARQDMFPSQSPQYNNLDDGVAGDDGAGKNDNIGSDETPMDDNFDPAHPLYRELARLAAVTRGNPALRDGAQQHRYSSSGPGVYAFSRISRKHQREYVVALNNAEAPASASIPTYVRDSRWEKVYGAGPRPAVERPRPEARRHARAALGGRLPREGAHPAQQGGAVGRARRAGRGPRPPRGAREPRRPTRSPR